MISEDRLQQEIFTYHWNNYPDERGLLFHVYNGAINAIQGAQLKSKGMVKGVSDLVYLKPGGVPLLIELKAETGRQSNVQQKWEASVVKAGYRYYVCRSLNDMKLICGWNK